MKTFFYTACGLLIYTAVVFSLATISSAFSQLDTLNKKKDSLSVVLQTKSIPELKELSQQKDVERDMLMDSIARNFQTLGNLKPSVEQTSKNFKVAENNLTETILKSDGDVRAIEKVYRIDTSPRPVIINIIYPVLQEKAPARKRGWLFKR